MSDSSPVTLSCKYRPFDPYSETDLETIEVTGSDLREALRNLVDSLHIYLVSNNIIDDDMPAEDILHRLETESGDGCDEIIEVRDEDSGELLIDNHEETYRSDEWVDMDSYHPEDMYDDDDDDNYDDDDGDDYYD